MYGERLRLGRKKAGLSLRDLSARLDTENRVSAQAIGKYERGAMMPSSDVILALSKALGEPVRYFVSPMGVKLERIDFRKKSKTSARNRALVEAAVLDHVERYLIIEEILDLDSSTWDAPVEPMNLSNSEEAERLAERVRSNWQLGIDPISDLTELLEERGVKVFAIRLPDDVSGLTCLARRSENGRSVPVIVVNAHHNIERRRMTLAHELAHRVMSSESTVDEEKFAARFASAFLMPYSHLKLEVGQRRYSFGHRELVALKHLYRVRGAAILVRLEQVGIITHSTMNRLFRTVANGWRKTEPSPIEDKVAENANRFERLCFRALSEDLITMTKAIELVGKTSAKILQEIRGPDSATGNR